MIANTSDSGQNTVLGCDCVLNLSLQGPWIPQESSPNTVTLQLNSCVYVQVFPNLEAAS